MERATRDALQRDMCSLRDGDREAFARVYALVWPLVHSFSTRLLGDHASADDAAQQALLKVFSRIMAFDPTRDALPWILGIAHNECRTIRQQTRRTVAKHTDESPTDTANDDDPEQSMADAELHAALHDVIGELRPEEIETLWAAAGRIPKPANIPAATFRKRFQRALTRLKSAWRKRHEHL